MKNWSEKTLKRIWKGILVAVLLLIVFTFSPWVLVKGKIDPILFSMPYHLWVSILSTILLVVFTGIGGKVFYHLKLKTDPNANL